jgi:ABC-2 type transport system permease protein
MLETLHMVVHNLRLVASDRAGLAWLLVMPVVFTLIMGFAFSGRGRDSPGPVRYGLTVANMDRGPRGAELLEALRESDKIDLLLLEGAEAGDQARTLVKDGDRSSALVIPSLYSSRVDSGLGVTLHFYRNPERINPHVTRQAVGEVIARVNAESMIAAGARGAYTSLWGEPSESTAEKIAARGREFVAENWEPAPIAVVVEVLGRRKQREVPAMGFSRSSPAMALMFVLMMGLMMSGALVEERRHRTLLRLFSAPLRRSQIIAANLLWRFVVGMGQLWFLIALGAVLFRVDWGDTWTGLLLVTVAFALAVSSLSVLIGTLARSSRQAESLSLLISLTMCALGGLWWPLEITPKAYQQIGHMIPTGWAMDAMQNLVSRGYSLGQIAPQAMVLAGFAVAFGVFACITFRYE